MIPTPANAIIVVFEGADEASIQTLAGKFRSVPKVKEVRVGSLHNETVRTRVAEQFILHSKGSPPPATELITDDARRYESP